MKSVWRLEIGREVHDGVMVLALGGRLGTASSGHLRDAVIQAMDAGHLAILVDLEGVDYMSGAGLLALDAAAGRLRAAGGRLALCSACDAVRVILEFGGLPADVPLEVSRQSGLQRLRREPPIAP